MKEQKEIFSKIQLMLDESGFSVSNIDMNRPWGGFFVISEEDADKFIEKFFPAYAGSDLLKGKLSPKVLVVAPNKKLSWQYHSRRSELWTLIDGEVAVVTSETDVENETVFLQKGDTITLRKGERHRLVGLSDWGTVAEIWIHTDITNPSDEEDIVRLQDDFGR